MIESYEYKKRSKHFIPVVFEAQSENEEEKSQQNPAREQRPDYSPKSRRQRLTLDTHTALYTDKQQNRLNTKVQKFGKEVSSAHQRLPLFDKKYSKDSNTVKYY